MPVKPHECIHEDMLLGQSRAIERLDAELNYKKEKLDDLKRDNEKMQDTLDDIKECVNKIVLTSKKDDDVIKNLLNTQDNRITTLETQNRTLKWVIGLGFIGLSTAITGIGVLVSIIH